MEVKDFNENVFADIFSPSVTNTTTISSTADTTTASVTDTTTLPASTGDTTTVVPDVFGDSDKDKVIVTTKQKQIDGIAGYFEDRIKNKKFVALKEVDDDGNESLFVPKTAEEFDEVIDLQVDYKLNQKTKELEQKWYQSKSPAWQAVAKYAELVTDPSLLIPFLQGVRTIESVKDVDETQEDGAEFIVRTALEQKGNTKALVDVQIDSLKSSNKLVDAAKEYKPLILREEQQAMMQERMAAEQEQKRWIQDIAEIETAAVKTIETPIFGKQKLTREEKAIVYDMIAQPLEETQGYGVYAALDKLFEKRDVESMETLKQVALLLAKKDTFFNYLGTSVANQTAGQLHKKLKVADSMSSSSGNQDTDDQPVITRNKFTRTPKFGSFQQ